MLLDPGSRCASPHSIDGVAFGVVAWLTSRILTVQVGQTVLDCYNYQWLNRFTVKNQYPLPLIADLTSSFVGAHIFTKLDIQ